MAKYTKFCNAESLIKNIQSEEKDQQCMHILLSVFKRPLAWLEDQYDRQGFLDSIPLLEMRIGEVNDDLAWLYIVQGTAWYHQMPFLMSQFMRFSNFQAGHLKLQPNGVYVILTQQSMNIIKGKDHQRQKQKIVKFIKSNIFYPCYLQDQLAKQFSGLIRVKHLRYNKCLNWKDDDGSLKLGIVYKGIIGIQYDWKRRVQLAQMTRGMFLTNHYIRDYLQEIEEYSLDPLEDIQSKKEDFPKFRFVSRSEETILLIFNSRLISEPPFNINPDIKHNIKKQFQVYVQKLNSVIGQQGGLLYRNKKSIKQQLKRRKDKQTINIQISKQMMKDSTKRLSPMLMMYTTVNVPSNSLQKINSQIFKVPKPPKQYSHSIFTTISPRKLNRSRTQTIQRSADIPSNTNIVHNTWLQEVNKKHKQTKSFSTLRNLSTYHSDRHKQHQTIQIQIQNHKQAKFFVPEQFVKRKLKLKYQNLMSKIKNFDLRIQDKVQQGLTDKMKRLEEYIDSKRIVKLNTVKTKHRLLRDRVNY